MKTKINNKIFPRDYNIINEERSIFANNIDVNYINYIFIDESSFCVNDYARYGYSKKGEIITKNYIILLIWLDQFIIT